ARAQVLTPGRRDHAGRRHDLLPAAAGAAGPDRGRAVDPPAAAVAVRVPGPGDPAALRDRIELAHGVTAAVPRAAGSGAEYGGGPRLVGASAESTICNRRVRARIHHNPAVEAMARRAGRAP